MTALDRVCVLVPTCGRPSSLRLLLDALAEQDDPGVPWSVLVVDNRAPGDVPGDPIDLSRIPIESRVVREPLRGASYARNRGLDEIDAPLTVLLDDDAAPDRGWLAALVEPILAGRADVTAGPIVLQDDVAFPAWMGPSFAGYLTAYSRGDDEVALSTDDFFLTCNAAAPTELFRRAGGFHPALGPRPRAQITNDDVALSLALHDLDARIVYVPTARVVHEVPTQRLRPGWVLRRAHSQGRSDRRLELVRGRERVRRRLALRHGLGVMRGRFLIHAREGFASKWVAFHTVADLAYSAGYLREVLVGNDLSRRSWS